MGKNQHQIQWTSAKVDNHKLSLGASEEVTYYSDNSGTDNGASPYKIYFNMERAFIGVTIRATVACSLTHFNGKALKSPLTLNAGTNKLDVAATSFKIVSTASTVIEVTVK